MKSIKALALTTLFVALAGLSPPPVQAQATPSDIAVRLRPVAENIPLVTDINVVGSHVYICTQPGLLLRKSLNTVSTHDATVFLDLRARVGMLGARIPALPGLGYPIAGTYDERGLLGFVADPNFSTNGRFWVWYTNISQTSSSPPDFFQWLTSTSEPWNTAQFDHVGYLDEYRVIDGTPQFRRTLLKVKRPYFNHTGFQSLAWAPDLNTLVLGLGDGGSEYDPNNIAQDDRQLSGKLLKIDLGMLSGLDFRNSAPVATFADLTARNYPAGSIKTLVKGMRNPSKIHFERTAEMADGGNRWIRYLANTGQDTIEFVHAFDHYGINFGFRAWEGIFPTSFSEDGKNVIAFGLEASKLPNFYRPMVQYTQLDLALGANANTGSALYWGDRIPGLKGQLVFIDWISFERTPQQGLLMHAAVNRAKLQRAQAVKVMTVDLTGVGLGAGKPLFYTAINTDPAGRRIFIGGFKEFGFIVNQRQNALGSSALAGGLYEVLPD